MLYEADLKITVKSHCAERNSSEGKKKGPVEQI